MDDRTVPICGQGPMLGLAIGGRWGFRPCISNIRGCVLSLASYCATGSPDRSVLPFGFRVGAHTIQQRQQKQRYRPPVELQQDQWGTVWNASGSEGQRISEGVISQLLTLTLGRDSTPLVGVTRIPKTPRHFAVHLTVEKGRDTLPPYTLHALTCRRSRCAPGLSALSAYPTTHRVLPRPGLSGGADCLRRRE